MKVFITRQISDVAVKMLIDNGIDVIVFDRDRIITKKEILKYAGDADGIISLLSDKFDAEILNKLKNCRIIANYAVGFNNIDLKTAKEKGIIVTNTPDILTDATADLTMSLILACARNLVAGHQMVMEGLFKGWKPQLFLGIELRGKTLGIIGAGRIGTAVATRASAFGMKIVYFSRKKNDLLEKNIGAKKVSIDKLMKTSDVLSVHLPLNKETYHFLDKDKLNLMKDSAVFVNTARGEILDEVELISILKQKRIFSAGFDVYENEPQLNSQLYKLENVVLLPHLGSATFVARNKMAELAAENIIRVLKGKKPLTEVFYK
jgi:glyoxylate reductase